MLKIILIKLVFSLCSSVSSGHVGSENRWIHSASVSGGRHFQNKGFDVEDETEKMRWGLAALKQIEFSLETAGLLVICF